MKYKIILKALMPFLPNLPKRFTRKSFKMYVHRILVNNHIVVDRKNVTPIHDSFGVDYYVTTCSKHPETIGVSCKLSVDNINWRAISILYAGVKSAYISNPDDSYNSYPALTGIIFTDSKYSTKAVEHAKSLGIALFDRKDLAFFNYSGTRPCHFLYKSLKGNSSREKYAQIYVNRALAFQRATNMPVSLQFSKNCINGRASIRVSNSLKRYVFNKRIKDAINAHKVRNGEKQKDKN